MVIVGGPSGAGKSSVFSIYRVDDAVAFGTDDYCAALNAERLGRQQPVYEGIPPDIRTRGGIALQKFIGDSIAARQSFTFETTLREITFEQARRAKASGFLVEMIFVAAGPVEEHIKRVKIRADAGGHSASEGSLREIYERACASRSPPSRRIARETSIFWLFSTIRRRHRKRVKYPERR